MPLGLLSTHDCVALDPGGAKEQRCPMNDGVDLESPRPKRSLLEQPPRRGASGETTLVLRGTIAGAELGRLANAIEVATRARSMVVRIELTDLVSWSLLAQAMVLSAARNLARGGGELVLANPTTALRLQAAHLGIFGRVRTTENDWRTPGRSTATETALVTVERRRALLVRRAGDPILRLPGGPVNDGDDVRRALADYVAAQLGIDCDERALQPSGSIPSGDPGGIDGPTRLVCFEAPFSAAILERASNGTELVWATYRLSGVFTPTAQLVLRALHSGGHID